jgi:integrase
MTSIEFSSPGASTLLQLKQELARRYDLPHQRRMDLVSALNTLGRWTGRPLELLAADPRAICERFKHLSPAAVGASPRRFCNVRSFVLAALREGGIVSQPPGSRIVLSPAWQDLFDRVTDRYLRTALSRFVRLCSHRAIAPEAVDDSVAARLLEALARESLIKDPRLHHQTTCRTWNQCVDQVAGWPQTRLTVPRFEDRIFAIDWDLVPAPLADAIERYLESLSGGSPFAGPPRPFRPNTLNAKRQHLRAFVSALHHAGYDLARIEGLADLVKPEVARVGLEWLWKRAGNKMNHVIGEIAWTLRTIAFKHLEADEETVTFYKDACARLRVDRRGLSAKNRDLLHNFDDPARVNALLRVPDRLRRQASTAKGRAAALAAQTAVAVELLLCAPMRLANLNELRLDRHLSWVHDRLHIRIPRQEVKNSEDLHYVLPLVPSAHAKQYIDEVRPQLADPTNPYLFPGRHGRPKERSRLMRQITRAVEVHVGVRMTPHQFRHAVAKIYLDRRPGQYEVVRKMLGHKDLTTTYEAYSGAETQAAAEHFDEVILAARHEPVVAAGVQAKRRRRRVARDEALARVEGLRRAAEGQLVPGGSRRRRR